MIVPLYISYVTLLMFFPSSLKSSLKWLTGLLFFFFQCLSQAKLVVSFLLLKSVTAEVGS